MAATIVGVFQPDMQKLITESRILLIGTGGIGCEVLKNLVLMGFSELEVIDLDTIEVSNLNRQFLFNKESVGKAKSHVAKESVLKFNPNVNIKSHLGDITDQMYGAAFFNKFELVINALDNKKARNHVNRMCLSCDIPLIESGTMGYSGQVEFIKKGLSLCYECLPKAEPKTYPMCTIRNTPKEPIHCIIWAKFLFGQLFGEAEEDVSMEEEVTSKDTPAKVSAREWAMNNDYDPKKLFNKIFIDDIVYLLNMPVLFKDKISKPELLDKCIIDNLSPYAHEPDNKVLSLAQYATMFLDSVDIIRETFKKSNKCLVWDKDDDNFMNFVVSCSNLRAAIFHIPSKSHFDIKSMAGNIVPAIATANAMVAGQIVIHALRILKGEYARCQSVFLRQLPNHKGGILVKDRNLQKPNPKCSTCSTEGEILLSTDINTFTMKQFEELVLKKKLNMVQPDVIFNGNVLISSDEEDEIDLNKTLIEMGIQSGSRVSVDDYHQNYSIKIIIHHKQKTDDEDPEFTIFGNADDLIKANKSKEEADEDGNVSDESDYCVLDRIDNELIETANQENQMIIDSTHETIDYELTKISNEQEVSNEELLALKRKAEDNGDISESKKPRTDN